MKQRNNYAIRAKFTARAQRPGNGTYESTGIYLGKRGQWCSLEKALTFKTLEKAEMALQEKWNRLRNSGVKGIILSVVTLGKHKAS